MGNISDMFDRECACFKKNTPCLVGSKEGTGYHTEYAKEEKNICLIAAAAFMEGLLFLQINIFIF